MTPAAAALLEARRTGLRFQLEGGSINLTADREPAPEILAALAANRPELIEILRGNRCRRCGGRLAWPGPAGVVFADGTSECMRCAHAEVGRLLEVGQRAVESPDALADPAEVMLRGEPI